MAAKPTRAAEVLDVLDELASRCEHDWLAACLVDCQQLVLKATLDSLQRGKASGIKRRAPSEDIPLLANHAHEEDAGHKPAPADAAPRGAYTKTTEQAPAPKRPATEAHVTYQDNGPQTAGRLTRASAASGAARASNASPAAAVVALAASQAQAATAVRQPAPQKHEPASGGARTARTVDTQPKSLSMASHSTKAQWPPEMAAIVAEEMIAADKSNRTINLRYLVSRLGDNYSERQIKTKVDTFRKQQRRNPDLFTSGDPHVVVGLAPDPNAGGRTHTHTQHDGEDGEYEPAEEEYEYNADGDGDAEYQDVDEGGAGGGAYLPQEGTEEYHVLEVPVDALDAHDHNNGEHYQVAEEPGSGDAWQGADTHEEGVTKVPIQASVNRPPTSEHLKLRVKNMIASAVLRRGSNQPET